MSDSVLAQHEVSVRQRYSPPGGWSALDDLVRQGWHLAATLTEERREPRYESWDRAPVGSAAMRFLCRNFPAGVYLHQAEARRRLRSGANACLTTATASGKSAVFYARGLAVLEEDPDSRVLAIGRRVSPGARLASRSRKGEPSHSVEFQHQEAM